MLLVLNVGDEADQVMKSTVVTVEPIPTATSEEPVNQNDAAAALKQVSSSGLSALQR